MTPIRQLSKTLEFEPQVHDVDGLMIRCWAGPNDIAAWLALRDQAFARQKIGVQQWTEADFRREFLDKPWWKPERLWLAEIEQDQSRSVSVQSTLVGAVTLADRTIIETDSESKKSERIVPVVHWLMVHPRYRQRGIATALISRLEAAVWQSGGREIRLETHAGWEAAAKFYESRGYKRL